MKTIDRGINKNETKAEKVERLISVQSSEQQDMYTKCCRVLAFSDYVSVHKPGEATYAFAKVVLCSKCLTAKSEIIRYNGYEPYKFFGSRKNGLPPENFKLHHWRKMQGFLSEYAMLNVRESREGEISYFEVMA